MSFGLSRGKPLQVGDVGLDRTDLPPLPDNLAQDPRAAWIDPREWFPNPERRFELEIGSGKGAFILEQAAAKPDVNFLGVEWAGEFYRYAADRCRRRALPNVRLLHDDATELLHWRIPDAIVDVIHLYFSDPWPKKRHNKRRVVQDRFLADAHRALRPGAELRIVTDHEEYWAWMQEHFTRWSAPERVPPRFELLPFTPDRRAEGAREGEIVGTNFERKYAREGRPFHAAVLRKPE